MKKCCILAVFLFGLVGTLCAGEVLSEDAYASYYGDAFQGLPTASGEIFDMNAYTAAHKTVPFGTLLEVTNLENGKKVVVRVNDRGPFIANRELDLSKAAAASLGMLESGLTRVKITVANSLDHAALVAANEKRSAFHVGRASSDSSMRPAEWRSRTKGDTNSRETPQGPVRKNQNMRSTESLEKPVEGKFRGGMDAYGDGTSRYEASPAYPYRNAGYPEKRDAAVDGDAGYANESVRPVNEKQERSVVDGLDRSDRGSVSAPAVVPEREFSDEGYPHSMYDEHAANAEEQPAKTANEQPKQVYEPAHDGIMWRIQLGSFVREENALRLVVMLRRLGIEPAYERTENAVRVVIPGIADKDVETVKAVLKEARLSDYIIRQESW